MRLGALHTAQVRDAVRTQRTQSWPYHDSIMFVSNTTLLSIICACAVANATVGGQLHDRGAARCASGIVHQEPN
jgi:hypothetical protein